MSTRKKETKYSDNIKVFSDFKSHKENHDFDELMGIDGYKFSFNKTTGSAKKYEVLNVYTDSDEFVGKIIHYIYYYNDVMKMFNGEPYEEDNKVIFFAGKKPSYMPNPYNLESGDHIIESDNIYDAFCKAAVELIS